VSTNELDDAAKIEILSHGEMSVVMRMPYSSNATFLVSLTHDEKSVQAIYKPLRGERPLWDFEPGLHRREVAAYLLSETMGLGCVPPTVLRDGPNGEGSVQLLIEANPDEHYFTIFEERQDLHDQFRAMCMFDIVAMYSLTKTHMFGASITEFVFQVTSNCAPSSGSSAVKKSPKICSRKSNR